MGAKALKLKTRDFGVIDYDPEHVIHFRQGLFAFEKEHEFLLLPFEGIERTLLCMQSVQTPELAFTIMNPFALKPDYAPTLQTAELEAMGVAESQELCYYVFTFVRQPVSECTANLKCPVAINDSTMEAMQVILNTDAYNMRHRFAEFGWGGKEAPC